jgi:hypothetical protein
MGKWEGQIIFFGVNIYPYHPNGAHIYKKGSHATSMYGWTANKPVCALKNPRHVDIYKSSINVKM